MNCMNNKNNNMTQSFDSQSATTSNPSAEEVHDSILKKVLQLKLELATELGELDYLRNQTNTNVKTLNKLRTEKFEIERGIQLKSAIQRLHQRCKELDDEIDMHFQETQLVRSLISNELKMKQSLVVQEKKKKKSHPNSHAEVRSSRYLRHQKRRLPHTLRSIKIQWKNMYNHREEVNNKKC